MLTVLSFAVGALATNCYIITDKGQELLKQEYERLKRQVEEGRSFFEVAYA